MTLFLFITTLSRVIVYYMFIFRFRTVIQDFIILLNHRKKKFFRIKVAIVVYPWVHGKLMELLANLAYFLWCKFGKMFTNTS